MRATVAHRRKPRKSVRARVLVALLAATPAGAGIPPRAKLHSIARRLTQIDVLLRGSATSSKDFVKIALQISLMLSFALLFGQLVRRIKQPAILGEIIVRRPSVPAPSSRASAVRRE